MFKKGYFVFSIMSNTDFEKLLKIISQRALVKLQAETVFTQSLSNTYDELLLISRIHFSITPLNGQKQSFKVVL